MFDIVSSLGSILLVLIGSVAIGRVLFMDMIPTIRSGFVESRVAKTGIAVNADIVAAHQTSSWGGNKPIYHITVHFITQNGDKVESSIEKALTFEEIERYKPGNGITIKYEPHKPKNIAIRDKPIILGD